MYHYTYKLTINNATDSRKYYIGVRSSNKHPIDDITYLGSCKTLLEWFKCNGTDNVEKEILAIYDNRKDAIQHEIELHDYFNIAKNALFWNKAKQTSIGFDTTGTQLSEEVKHQKSIFFKNLVRTEEHKQNISKALKGKTRTKEHCLALSNAKKGKPSPLKGMSLGKGRSKSEEHKRKIGLANKGKKRTEEYCKRMSKLRKGIKPKQHPEQYAKIECPHCGKIGMKANMKRYHYDNCKVIK